MKTKDGLELFINDWILPDTIPVKGSVMIVHGIGEHCLRYNHIASFFNSLGFIVRSYDQRGFGRSEGKKSFLPSENILVDDLKFMFNSFSDEMKRKGVSGPPLIFGHSMGGCITARAVTGGWIKPKGMILSSPGLKPKMNPVQKFLFKIVNKAFPDVQFNSGLPIHKLSRDINVIKAAITDPYCHGKVTARIIQFMFSAGESSINDAGNINIPVLLLAAGNDAYVYPEATELFYKNMNYDLAEFHLYKNCYHEIFNELPDDREKVFTDLRKWMEKYFPAM